MRAVDLFSGAGGWTTGATMAGLRVLAAVNHWPLAVETHSTNHPDTLHRCQDVGLMDPRDLPAHDVLLASPACQGHSKARGKEQPHHDAQRSTAWCVVDVAEVCRPRLLLVENVPDMREWALYGVWRMALSALGYSLTEAVLDAADAGVPQERRRLFVVGTLGRRAPELRSPAHPRVPVRNVLELDAGPWSPVHHPRRAANTLRRVEAGRAAHGPDFLAPYYGSGSGLTGRSLDRPCGTLTTRDRYALVRGDRMRMLSVLEQKRVMGFPEDYRLSGTRAEQVHQLGNAVPPPLAAEVVRQVLEAA